MDLQEFKRKLTAILSADVVGYSRLMGDDEAATVRTIESYRRVIADMVRQHRGRVVDSPGDNLLAEFASVVDAVQCAVAVQTEIEARNRLLPESRAMHFRIGINLGDVIEEGERLYGDGVNIAARLESLATPGGICISRTAFDHIETKLPLGYEYIGEQAVKNIARPVGAYRVLMEPRVTVATVGPKWWEVPFVRWVMGGLLVLLLSGAGVWGILHMGARSSPRIPPGLAFLRVETSPPGAAIYVDGVAKGLSPAGFDISLGEHRFRLELAGHQDWDEKISVSQTTPSPLKIELVRLALLKAASTPPGAEVYVNEVMKGRTPLQLGLPMGEYTLRMVLSGYQEWKDRIRVEQLRDYPVEVNLRKEIDLAWLKIDSSPMGADIYVNDRLQGTTPMKSGLPLGDYSIRLAKPGYRDYDTVVKLSEPREVHLTLDLERDERLLQAVDQVKASFEKGKELFSRKNYKEALEQFRLAAVQGQAESQNEVGYMIMHGLGVKKDPKEAATWLRKAAAQGNASSQNNLGILYLKGGPGIKPDDREAFAWFRLAAEQGDRDGQFYLGNMYRYGRGQAADLNQAVEWYRKAASQGHEGAARALAALGK
jgi:class 3 adenylate cyclase/tetratricopeptide (TPR) repeat protein